MKKVLISNIGNRNIKYTGTLINTNEHNHLNTKTFRANSEILWKAFETEKEYISEEIIVNQIERLGEDLQVIILFVTNQEGQFNFQDTVFEGKILQRIFQEQYDLKTIIYEFNGNPTDEEQIVQYAAGALKEIIAQYSEEKLVYNDAGGTPQMKSVIKDLLRYYLSEEKFLITYSDQNDQIFDKKRLYGQKYTLLKSARDFVTNYEYKAAGKIISDADKLVGVNKGLMLYVQMAAARKNFNREYVKGHLQKADTPKSLRKNRLFQSYAQGKVPDDIEIFPEVFSGKSQSDIFEIASICQLYFQQKIYTLGVATYYRLCEEILQSWARETYSEYDLTKDNHRKKMVTEFINDLKEDYPKMRSDYGLPFLMVMALKFGEEEIKTLVQTLTKSNSFFSKNKKGIDLLRNKSFLAHKNQSVTPTMINKTNTEFLNQLLPEIFALLNLPTVNIYDQMNQDIYSLFHQE